jgi:hypothetical protein
MNPTSCKESLIKFNEGPAYVLWLLLDPCLIILNFLNLVDLPSMSERTVCSYLPPSTNSVWLAVSTVYLLAQAENRSHVATSQFPIYPLHIHVFGEFPTSWFFLNNFFCTSIFLPIPSPQCRFAFRKLFLHDLNI